MASNDRAILVVRAGPDKGQLRAAEEKEEKKQRQRRFHSRSRTGCSSCRMRHVRCDEDRPVWYVCFFVGSSNLKARLLCEDPPFYGES